MGRTLGVALILWPFASALLLGLHRAGRALHTRLTRRSSTMTFHYTDPDGDRLTLHGMRDDNDRPVVHFGASSPDGVYVDVDRIEEVIAGLRDERRQAADGPNPQHLGNKANAEDCPACHGTNPPYPFLCPGGGS